MQYVYNSGSNNGQVASTTDNISGETVQYTYDSLLRLIQAQTSSGGTQWGEAYSYDGFGNLTGKTPTQGSAPALSVTYNPATNQPASGGYDANGNAPVGTWDAENHLVQQTLDGATLNWVYDPDGRRAAQFQQMSGYGQWTFYVYGAKGQLLGQIGCSLYANPSSSVCAAQRSNVYFGGRLIARMESQSGTMVAEGVVTDRLGTVRAVQASAGWSTPAYFPYGEVMMAGGVAGQEQFATYVRDSTLSAQDYAEQRYYSNNTGRFFSPDPSTLNVNLANPSSWDKYAYVNGDPANSGDPTGLIAQAPPPPDLGLSYYWCSLNSSDPTCGISIGWGYIPLAGGDGGGIGGGSGSSNPCAYGSLTPAQQSMVDPTYWGTLSAAAQEMFVVVTDDIASLLGQNALNGWSVSSITVAGTNAGTQEEQTQTELTFVNGNLSTLNNLIWGSGDFQCGGFWVGPSHFPGGNNCRQNTPTWSLQGNTALQNGTATAQFDIDPYNPAANKPWGALQHIGLQWIPNHISGGDTNYFNAASALKINVIPCTGN